MKIYNVIFMAECILLVVAFALFMLHVYRDLKLKKLKEHWDYVYECNQSLNRLTRIFHGECEKIAEEVFVKYSALQRSKYFYSVPDYMKYSFIKDYRDNVKSLEEDYITNLKDKYSGDLSSVPKYLIEDYSKSINHISRSFIDYGYVIRREIEKEFNNLS